MKLVVLDGARDSFKRSLRVLSKRYSKAYLKSLKRRIASSLEWLKEHPGAGQMEPELEWLNMDHRRIIVGPFKVIYRVKEDTIIVNDIFDTRRDPRRMKS